VLDHGALERLKNDAALSQLIGDYIAMNKLIAGKDQAPGNLIESARLIENLGTVVIGQRSSELKRSWIEKIDIGKSPRLIFPGRLGQ